MTAQPIRDAATVIVLRTAPVPAVLMGRRGRAAAFMPDKFVFPGGAVDPDDAAAALAGLPAADCMAALAEAASAEFAPALVAAAIRETWEETGLILGVKGAWPTPPPAQWRGFARTGHRPDGRGLRFVFRAITPPGRPRRFDARFFLADAGSLVGDPDDLPDTTDELSDLQWIPLDAVRDFDLPFITEVVMAEVARMLRDGGKQPGGVPFFRNDDEESLFLRLHGSPLPD